MRRIVIETYAIIHSYVGIGEFCTRLGHGLAEKAAFLRAKYGIELYFIVPPEYRGCFGNEVHYICMPLSLRWWLILYPLRADIFHLPHQYCQFKNLVNVGNRLMTIHDINFIYEKQGEKLQRAVKRFEKKIRRMDFTNYISEFVREDTNRHFSINVPEKVIYNGVTDLTSKAEAAEDFIARLPKHFMFHISSLLPKKNPHLLIEMMQFLPDENLVIAGSWVGDYGRRLEQMIEDLPTHNVFRLNNVSERQKAYLYARCKAFLFPSLCEGFGLPPVEAMKFGKPVFLSTLTSLPEIGGKDAFYWPDLTPRAMADKVKECLFLYMRTPSYPMRMKQNAARFGWDACISQYIEYYLEILNV